MNTDKIVKFLFPGWLVCLLGLVSLIACTQGASEDMNTDTTETDLVGQWRQALSGTRLHHFHTYRSSGMGFTRIQKLDLCPQGYYNYYAEASFDTQGPIAESGTWTLQQTGDQVQLVLTPQGEQTKYSTLGMNAKKNIVLWDREFIPGQKGEYAPNCQ